MRGELAVLYRVARRMGASAELAEDLVQTTLVKAFQAWSNFDGTYLRSWLIKILRNERFMALRAEHPTSAIEDLSDMEHSIGPFWDQVDWSLEANRILTELDRLPDIHKLVIHLIDVEQLTYEEAAQVLDVPIGTVRSRLFRAREMLRSKLIEAKGSLEEVSQA